MSDIDTKSIERTDEPEGDSIKDAEADVRAAKAEIKDALHDLEVAERDLDHAEEELHERRHDIEVSVDGKLKCVPRGTYIVSAFKILVGVAPDRELDILKDGILHPLKDDEKIKVYQCEVFVSHVCTGSSA